MDPVGPDRLSQPVILSDQQDQATAAGDLLQTLRLGLRLRTSEAAIDDAAAWGQDLRRRQHIRHTCGIRHEP